MQVQASLPPLPASSNGLWSSQVRETYSFLNSKYSHAAHVLKQSGPEAPTRLLLLAEDLNSKSEALDVFQASDLPSAWIEAVALCCAVLLQRLMQAAQLGRGR